MLKHKLEIRRFHYRLSLEEFDLVSSFTYRGVQTIKLLLPKDISDTRYHVYISQILDVINVVITITNGYDVEEARDFMTEFYYDLIGFFMGLVSDESYKEKYPSMVQIKDNL